MAVAFRVMSWNIQKKTGGAAYIAEIMRSNQIDICALLEMPNSNVATTLTAIVAALNNLAPAYLQNEWLWQAVNVGNEAVGFVWHQNNTVSGNAFQIDLMASGQRVCGAVTRNAANDRIYFPKTQTSWASLPGKPGGRRPAYISFVTNDGAAPRRFTVLDLHTPFSTATSIQSYATSLMATSREITLVDRTDLPGIAVAAQTAGGNLDARLALIVDPIITGMTDHGYINTLLLCTNVVTGAVRAIDGDETDLQTLVQLAGAAGARNAVDYLAIPVNIDNDDAQALAVAVAMAAAGAAATLVASAQLPTGPVGATASATVARAIAMNNARNVVGQLKLLTKRRKGAPTASQQRETVLFEAQRIVDAALQPFTFNPLPLSAVNASIIAGDFNVNYPDTIVYQGSQQTAMGAANAYTRLLALGAARNTEMSTRIGPTAFRGQLVYRLTNPCPIQSTNKAQPSTYVPLDVGALVTKPTSFLNWTSWTAGLQNMAAAQSISWASLTKNFGALIGGAFDKDCNNDTRFYRANCYDNIFVRGGTVTASGLVDVISALGSWAAGPVLANPQPALGAWAAASRQLNALAQAYLGTLPPPLLTYGYDGGNVKYTITAALADAIEAAVFFDQYVSDHLPVTVAVQV